MTEKQSIILKKSSKTLEYVQTDNNRSQKEILEVFQKLHDAYKDEENQ